MSTKSSLTRPDAFRLSLDITRGAMIFVALCLVTVACERDTQLTIEQTDPPKFIMSGSGTLGSLRVVGPKRRREAFGEDASVYWMIKPEPEGDPENVEALSPITYGRVPTGYIQVYPEQGANAPALVDGQKYFVDISTNAANGVRRSFVLSR
jgi:hypothetical protein